MWMSTRFIGDGKAWFVVQKEGEELPLNEPIALLATVQLNRVGSSRSGRVGADDRFALFVV